MRHILIVDDDVDSVALLSRALQQSIPCINAHAFSAHEAIGMLQQGFFDLVICDFEMPGESGLKVAKEVAHSHRTTQLMFYTGTDLGEAIHLNGKQFLVVSKPELLTLLKKVSMLFEVSLKRESNG